MPGSELGAVTGALDDDLVGGVGQPIQGAIAEDGIVEQAQPLVHAPIGREAKTRSAVTFNDELVPVVARLGGQTTQSEIVQDDQVWSELAAEDLVVGAIRAGLTQLGQQGVGTDEQHRMAGADAG